MRISRGLRICSLSISYQVDEDIFKRALGRLQILEHETRFVKVFQQGGNTGAVDLRVVGIDQVAATTGQSQVVGGERRRDTIQRTLQVQRQLLLAEFAHKFGF